MAHVLNKHLPLTIVFVAAACGPVATSGDASMDGGRRIEAGLDGGPDAGRPLDSGRVRSDAYLEAAVPDGWPTGGVVFCGDTENPGFEPVGDLWRPCACFGGMPLATVPMPHHQGPFSSRFDCDWPPGAIWFNDSRSTDPITFSPSGCSYATGIERLAGFYATPYVATYIPSPEVPDVLARTLCIPRRCVFAVPGEPAQCDTDCQPIPDDLHFSVEMTVDRTACAP